jgi:hypothetical protein
MNTSSKHDSISHLVISEILSLYVVAAAPDSVTILSSKPNKKKTLAALIGVITRLTGPV